MRSALLNAEDAESAENNRIKELGLRGHPEPWPVARIGLSQDLFPLLYCIRERIRG